MGSKLLGKLGGLKLYYIPQIDNVDCYVYFLQIQYVYLHIFFSKTHFSIRRRVLYHIAIFESFY